MHANMSSGNPGKKRNRLRDLFGKSAKEPSDTSARPCSSTRPVPGNGSVQLVPVPSPASLSQPSDPSDQFYTAALEKLDPEEQIVIKEHVASNVNDAVQAAYDAASKQKKICEDKKWVGSDKANKVLLWLDRFKSAGDIVANVDPLHVGLPWAGIRVLLEAAVADSHQMSALMSGMDLALCIANRLQAYVVYFQRLRPSLTTGNLRRALVALYAHLLGFLAKAIRIYSMNSATRRVQALWQVSDLTTFEDGCDKLGGRVDIEADNCERESRAEEKTEATRWKDDLEATLRKLDTIQSVQQSLNTLQIKVDLSKLVKVQEATYNSSAEEKLALCLDGTRSEILHSITQWAGKPDGEFMFWLCGKAGTGKSTISRTTAQRLDKQRCLGASFFFKRDEKDRSNADHFFSTIAAQLADLLPLMQGSIGAALDKDSFLCGRGLREQFEKLLLQPLLSIDPARLPRHGVVIVIDALDECDRDTDIRMFLKLLARLKAESALQLRVFITSRPELPIQLGFRQLDGSLHQDMVLEEIQEGTVWRDVRAYFDSEFAKIKEERLLLRPHDALPADWPSNDDIQTLVGLAVPLFIFASTVCRFISSSSPQKRLRAILEQRYSAGSSHLAKTYQPILNQLLLGEDAEEQEEILAAFRKVVGPIILAADPLSVKSLADLLDIDTESICDTLKHLHSVLQVPPSLHNPVRLLHQSFRDFLVDQKRGDKDGFWINERETHERLAYHCLERLLEPNTLKNDICCVEQPGFRRIQLAPKQIAMRIPADVAYACSHWPWHLVKSGEQLRDNDQVHDFLRNHLLHWLEVLSWLGRLSSVITHVDDLLSIAKGESCCEITAFLADAKRFILSHRMVVDLAPLQIYHSALIFTPRESIVRNAFQAEFPKLWSLLPYTPSRWSAELMRLEGHRASVEAVAYSPDGRVVASASSKELQLWDAQSGEKKHEFRPEGEVLTIAFSADSQVVAAGLKTMTGATVVRSWDVQTGGQMQRFIDPFNFPQPMVFTSDGQILAISSHSWTVQLFNTGTGEQMHSLEGHFPLVSALAFSPDNQVIASGSIDGTVQLWNMSSGVRTHKFRGHQHEITEIVFASDGRVIASALRDGTVQLWNTQTGGQMQTLDGHKDRITAMAFSPDRQNVATASADQTVRLWAAETAKQTFVIERDRCVNHHEFPVMVMSPVTPVVAVAIHDQTLQLWHTQTGERLQRLEGHDGTINAAVFSPDGQAIASASHNGTVRLWNTRTGEHTQTFNGYGASIEAVAFSPDGQTISLASHDGMVWLWNIRTGERTQTPGEQYRTTSAMVFVPGERIVTWHGSAGTGQCWSSRTGERICEFKSKDEWTRTMDFSPDSKILATGSYKGTIRLWDVKEGEQLHKFGGRDDEVCVTVAFSPNGQKIVSASRDGTVRLWDIETHEQILDFRLSKQEARAIATTFSSDGQVLAVAWDYTVQLWDTQTGKELHRLEGGCSAIAFSPDGRILAVSLFQTMQLWDVQTMEQTQKLEGHLSVIEAVAFSPDSQVVASASWDKTVRLWNTQHHDEPQMLRGMQQDRGQTVTVVDTSANGTIAVSVSLDERLRLWNMQTGKEIHWLGGWDARVDNVALSLDGRMVASVSLSRADIRLWDTRTGEQLRIFQFQRSDQNKYLLHLKAAVFSPDGQLIASITDMETLRVWHIQMMEEVQTLRFTDVSTFLPKHRWSRFLQKQIALTFSPDSQMVAVAVADVAGDSCSVQVWDVQTGKHIQTLHELEGRLPSFRSSTLSFSEDGNYLQIDTETFSLEWTPSGLLTKHVKPDTGLRLSGPWIQHQGQDLLYLPHEFRGKRVMTNGKTVVIGQASGAVSFFRLM